MNKGNISTFGIHKLHYIQTLLNILYIQNEFTLSTNNYWRDYEQVYMNTVLLSVVLLFGKGQGSVKSKWEMN